MKTIYGKPPYPSIGKADVIRKKCAFHTEHRMKLLILRIMAGRRYVVTARGKDGRFVYEAEKPAQLAAWMVATACLGVWLIFQ